MIRSALIVSLFSVSTFAHAATSEISGEVTVAKGATIKPGGALFVMAKEPGKPMPVAVLRVVEPKFPYKFTLSEKNTMMPGTPFTGSFLITARYSPTGDAMDKTGPEGTEAKPVAVGSKNVKIEMKGK